MKLQKISFFMFPLWFLAASFAQANPTPYQLKEKTPEVQQVFERRRERRILLDELKSKKDIGEDRYGHISNLSGLPNIQQVVDSENYDREVIYQAIVEQNKLGEGAIETVRSVFAQVHRDKAKPGEKMQMPSGEWMVK